MYFVWAGWFKLFFIIQINIHILTFCVQLKSSISKSPFPFPQFNKYLERIVSDFDPRIYRSDTYLSSHEICVDTTCEWVYFEHYFQPSGWKSFSKYTHLQVMSDTYFMAWLCYFFECLYSNLIWSVPNLHQSEKVEISFYWAHFRDSVPSQHN